MTVQNVKVAYRITEHFSMPSYDLPLPETMKKINNTNSNNISKCENGALFCTEFKLDRYKDKNKIPIFYNLLIGDENDENLGIDHGLDVNETVRHFRYQLQKNLPIHSPIYMNVIGSAGTQFLDGLHQDNKSIKILDKLVILGKFKKADDVVTLKALWDYCSLPENSEKKVIYLHNTAHNSYIEESRKLRRFMSVGALSYECSIAPKDSCNICSARFSPIPHPHSPGNMWAAECSYISKLIDPLIFEEAMETFYKVVEDSVDGYKDTSSGQCDGRKRYSIEHWVYSHPSAKPCDLFTEKTYAWGYDGIPFAHDLKTKSKLAMAPRLPMQEFLKPLKKLCIDRGISREDRVNEYQALYAKEPSKSWWGHTFYKETGGFWPYRFDGWAELPARIKMFMIELGFNQELWGDKNQKRRPPFNLWGRKWTELAKDTHSLLAQVGYTEESWNKEYQKSIRDMGRVNEAIETYEPNLSFDRCDEDGGDTVVEPWYKLPTGATPSSLRTLVYEAPKEPTDKKRVLVIAANPKKPLDVIALWTQLECFAENVDHVLITSPNSKKQQARTINNLVELAIEFIPHFKYNQTTLEVKSFAHNRYDVGLWCDGLASFGKDLEDYDEYGLSTGSIMALRKFSGIYDNLAYKNVSVTSLTYSYTYKWDLDYGPEAYWLDSSFRGFDQPGLATFQKHSCNSKNDNKICSDEMGLGLGKECLHTYLDHDLSFQYPCKKMAGLYPADSFHNLVQRAKNKRSWKNNLRYWHLLVDHMGFPVAKTDDTDHHATQETLQEDIGMWESNPMLAKCTKHIIDHLQELFDPDKMEKEREKREKEKEERKKALEDQLKAAINNEDWKNVAEVAARLSGKKPIEIEKKKGRKERTTFQDSINDEQKKERIALEESKIDQTKQKYANIWAEEEPPPPMAPKREIHKIIKNKN